MKLKNLKLLYAIHCDSGAMTTKGLSALMKQKGLADIDEDFLGSLLRNEKEMDKNISKRIEDAFDLADGWLEADFDFLESLSIRDTGLIRSVLTLSSSSKDGLHQFIINTSK